MLHAAGDAEFGAGETTSRCLPLVTMKIQTAFCSPGGDLSLWVKTLRRPHNNARAAGPLAPAPPTPHARVFLRSCPRLVTRNNWPGPATLAFLSDPILASLGLAGTTGQRGNEYNIPPVRQLLTTARATSRPSADENRRTASRSPKGGETATTPDGKREEPRSNAATAPASRVREPRGGRARTHLWGEKAERGGRGFVLGGRGRLVEKIGPLGREDRAHTSPLCQDTAGGNHARAFPPCQDTMGGGEGRGEAHRLWVETGVLAGKKTVPTSLLPARMRATAFGSCAEWMAVVMPAAEAS
eukprot:scaffold847_cov65-Isochrysis_galbana.AAC.1